jgi:hypothetical protein
MCKSSKLLGVMLTGVMLFGKKYNVWQCAAAATLVTGLVAFILADSDGDSAAGSGGSPTVGLFVIAAALLSDAFISFVQERVFQKHGAPLVEAIAWSNLFSLSASSFVFFFLSKDPVAVVASLIENWRVALAVGGYALSNFIGIFFVLSLIKWNGPALTVFVTSLRKALTLCLSFFLFPKAFYFQHGLGVLLFGISIFMQHKGKALEKWREAEAATRGAGKGDEKGAPPPSSEELEGLLSGEESVRAVRAENGVFARDNGLHGGGGVEEGAHVALLVELPVVCLSEAGEEQVRRAAGGAEE